MSCLRRRCRWSQQPHQLSPLPLPAPPVSQPQQQLSHQYQLASPGCGEGPIPSLQPTTALGPSGERSFQVVLCKALSGYLLMRGVHFVVPRGAGEVRQVHREGTVQSHPIAWRASSTMPSLELMTRSISKFCLWNIRSRLRVAWCSCSTHRK